MKDRDIFQKLHKLLPLYFILRGIFQEKKKKKEGEILILLWLLAFRAKAKPGLGGLTFPTCCLHCTRQAKMDQGKRDIGE